MLKVIVIPANDLEPVEAHVIDGSLASLQAIVGGLIQPLDMDVIGASIWCNEEGLLIGLPVNLRATVYLYQKAPEHRGFNVLVGECFITGQADSDGVTTDVPVEVIRDFGLDV